MIDPRPYTYQYRKPRLSNPTFQSSNLYESLYHLKAYKQNDYFMPEERTLINNRVQSKPVGESQNFKNINPERSQYENKQFISPRQKSMDLRQSENQVSERYQMRNQSTQKLPSINRVQNNYMQQLSQRRQSGSNSNLSNYGNNLMTTSNLDRFGVFERQQKGYNIINCYPTSGNKNLRNFPKYTLQNKLIQTNRYPRFGNN